MASDAMRAWAEATAPTLTDHGWELYETGRWSIGTYREHEARALLAYAEELARALANAGLACWGMGSPLERAVLRARDRLGLG